MSEKKECKSTMREHWNGSQYFFDGVESSKWEYRVCTMNLWIYYQKVSIVGPLSYHLSERTTSIHVMSYSYNVWTMEFINEVPNNYINKYYIDMDSIGLYLAMTLIHLWVWSMEIYGIWFCYTYMLLCGIKLVMTQNKGGWTKIESLSLEKVKWY